MGLPIYICRRTWNMPVHHWVTRHLYYPLLRAKCSKSFATLVVFLFSALMHEVAISLPFQHISFHAFLGMLAQAPLIYVGKHPITTSVSCHIMLVL
ncbi:hypothetical protein EON65_25945 [archaeon]|nr:MAG: hypothetical protein EON65_25945 [archaeon]